MGLERENGRQGPWRTAGDFTANHISSEVFLASSFVTEGITVSDCWPEIPEHHIHLVKGDGRMAGPLHGKRFRGHTELFAMNHMISVSTPQGHIPFVHSRGK